MDIIKSANLLFWTNPYYAILFVISLLYITVMRLRKGKGLRAFVPLVAYSVILMVLFINNPLFYKVTSFLYAKGAGEYVRMYFLLPFFQVIAYFLLNFFYRKHMPWPMKIIFVVAIWILIAGAGESMYENGMCVEAQNKYKISPEAVVIGDTILNETGGKGAKVVVDTGGLALQNAYDNRDNNIAIELIQYSAKIDFVGVAVTAEYYNDPVWWTGAADYVRNLGEAEETKDYEYLIMRMDNPATAEIMEDGGLEVVGCGMVYALMRRVQ